MRTSTHGEAARPISGRAMARSAPLAACLLLAAARAPAADVLWEWNDAALEAAIAARQLPFVQTRTMTMLTVAMFEAVNAVEPRYEPYALKEGPAAGASAEAAAAAAGRAVLTALFPERRPAWEQLCATSLGPPDRGVDAPAPEAPGGEEGVSAPRRARQGQPASSAEP
jgi:hypothetical protein